MSNKIKPFTGFSEGLFHFLSDLSENNNQEWFHKNRNRYQDFLVNPAKSFITELAPFLQRLNPEIRTEAKFNKTIMRLNKDMRFAKGDPYRTYFLLHFGRYKMDSEFFIYFEKDEIQIGLFINNSNEEGQCFKKNFNSFSADLVELFRNQKLNNKYSLYELNSGPQKILTKFNANVNLAKLYTIKYLLLQKVVPPSKTKIFSPEFLIETVKIFHSLYPLYLFCISDNPLMEIKRFKNEGLEF